MDIHDIIDDFVSARSAIHTALNTPDYWRKHPIEDYRSVYWTILRHAGGHEATSERILAYSATPLGNGSPSEGICVVSIFAQQYTRKRRWDAFSRGTGVTGVFSAYGGMSLLLLDVLKEYKGHRSIVDGMVLADG